MHRPDPVTWPCRGWRVMAVLAFFFLRSSPDCTRNAADNCLHHDASTPPPVMSSLPETLSIGALRLTARVALNRDFMPVCPPGGRPMSAHVRISEVDSLTIRTTVVPEYIWVVKGNQYWSTPLSPSSGSPGPEFTVDASANCGPKWAPGDVVAVGLRVRYGGKDHFLKVAETRIGSSE
jgi:hypothetical protein